MLIFFNIYIYWANQHLNKYRFSGWCKESLQEWGSFTALSCAGLMMICLQWWGLEACTILAGTLGEVELAAQSIIFQVNYFLYSVRL